MNVDSVKYPYDPRRETQELFNNRRQSDVRFLVEGQTVYGHKCILGMGSPVFNRMFYGDLKEEREVIEIEDLTLVGFKNALKYIYGFKINYKLSQLYESYMAGDMYLLHHFVVAFSLYCKSRLNPETICLVYDQLTKIQRATGTVLVDLKTIVIEESKALFESEHFKQIDQETLISLLSLEMLGIDEVELFVKVSKWVDCEVQRQGLPMNGENRRRVFEPIKGYLMLGAFTPEKVVNCQQFVELFTAEEIESLSNSENRLIELKTSRTVGPSICTVLVEHFFKASPRFIQDVHLVANRRVAIRTIYTTFPSENEKLKFFVRDSNGIDLQLNIERSKVNCKWRFSFNPPILVEANTTYILHVRGTGYWQQKMSLQQKLSYKDKVIFQLGFAQETNPEKCVRNYHYVQGIKFWRFE